MRMQHLLWFSAFVIAAGICQVLLVNVMVANDSLISDHSSFDAPILRGTVDTPQRSRSVNSFDRQPSHNSEGLGVFGTRRRSAQAYDGSLRRARRNVVDNNGSQGQGKVRKKGGLKMPEYLKDMTAAESFRGDKGLGIPLVAQLREQYPKMAFLVIPESRWRALDNTTCIPSNQTNFPEWHYRAPHALIIGTQKAGSSALAKYLYSHSQIVPTRKELHFLSERMDQYNNDWLGIDQRSAREHYLRHIQDAISPAFVNDFRSDHRQLYVVDATPMYLPKSDRVPQRVLCLCPWARLIVLLRDPVSRAYSQYSMEIAYHTVIAKRAAKNAGQTSIQHTNTTMMLMDLKKQPTSFDEWIQRDLDTLVGLGVLLPETATNDEWEAFSGSAKQDDAWKVYTKLGTAMPVGRGLYSLQLQHWIDAYAAKKQKLDLMAITSDDLKERTEKTYRKVLDFLGLPHEIPEMFKEHRKGAYHKIEPMSNSTRTKLERLFEPFNRQLARLLGPEWEDVWQPQ